MTEITITITGSGSIQECCNALIDLSNALENSSSEDIKKDGDYDDANGILSMQVDLGNNNG